jgi:hypothetical protein
MDMLYHPYRHLTSCILEAIADIPPLKPIHIIKVPAHNNIIGNEAADNIAKKTAKHINHPPQNNPNKPPPPPPFNILPTEPLNLVQQDIPPPSNKRIREIAHEHHKYGSANTDSTYHRLWKKVRAIWDPTLSNGFMLHPNTVTPKIQTTTLKLRTGTIHNQKRAKRYGHTNSDTCPICHLADSCTHIAGACAHPTMSKLYIDRHNAAGRVILKALATHSTKRQSLLSTDCGAPHKWGHTSLHNRLTTATLPCPQSLTKEQAAEHQTRLQTSRPDITLISNKLQKDKNKQTITLVELKFCHDTNHTRQLNEARTQHGLLQNYLNQTLGYEVNICPILVGTAGTIFTDHTLNSLRRLGLPRLTARRVCKDLHLIAVHHLHKILIQRRILEQKEKRKQPTPNTQSRQKRKRPHKTGVG